MPELGGSFDTSTAEKRESFPVITGWHPAQVIESDVVATKNGGAGAKFTFEIIDGQWKGRKVWGFINIQNPSPEAARIGQSELRELAEATVGPGVITNTDVLHFKPFELKCGADRNDPERTVPKGYRPYGTQAGAANGPAPRAATGGFRSSGPTAAAREPERAAAGGGGAPWRR